MFLALLICSDDECPDRFEAVGSLEELETLACDCCCGLQIVSLSELAGARSRAPLELALLDA